MRSVSDDLVDYGRYESCQSRGRLVIYDMENPLAWIASDCDVELPDMGGDS